MKIRQHSRPARAYICCPISPQPPFLTHISLNSCFLSLFFFVLFDFDMTSTLARGGFGGFRGGFGGGVGGGGPPDKGPGKPGRAHQATGTSMREKFNDKVRAMIRQGRPQVEVVTEDDITDMGRKASSATLATLRQRPPVRRYIRNPFDQVDYASREAYQVAAEGYLRGVVNPTPCDNCARGVEPHTRGLPIYPECVSVPLRAGADIDDPDTRWLMRGACMNCHHRSYTNCSCRKFCFRLGIVSRLTRH